MGATLGTSRMLEFMLDLNRPPPRIHSRETPKVIKKFKRGGRYVILCAFLFLFLSKLMVDSDCLDVFFLARMDFHDLKLPRFGCRFFQVLVQVYDHHDVMNCISGLFSKFYILTHFTIYTYHTHSSLIILSHLQWVLILLPTNLLLITGIAVTDIKISWLLSSPGLKDHSNLLIHCPLSPEEQLVNYYLPRLGGVS